MTATLAGGCNHTAPVSVVARRAGRTITAPLHSTGACTYAGSLAVTERGRWFTYVELDDNGRRAEAWLPVDAGVAGHRAQSRTLYRPAGSSPGHRSAEIAAGAPIYLAGFLILESAFLRLDGYRETNPRCGHSSDPGSQLVGTDRYTAVDVDSRWRPHRCASSPHPRCFAAYDAGSPTRMRQVIAVRRRAKMHRPAV